MTEWEINPEIMYFKNLSLRNFRGFQNVNNIQLAPLTFLVGPNSSGKSSIFDALLLISQSDFTLFDLMLQRPSWAGPLVDLGSYKDAVYQHRPTLSIQICIDMVPHSMFGTTSKKVAGTPRFMRLILNLITNKNDPIGRLASLKVVDLFTNESLGVRYTKDELFLDILGKVFRRKYRERPVHRVTLYDILSKLIEETLKEQQSRVRGRKAAWGRIKQMIPFAVMPIFTEVERVSSGRSAPRRWYSIAELAGTPIRVPYGSRVFSEIDPGMILETGDLRHRYPLWRRKRKSRFTLLSALEKLDIASSIKPSRLSPYHSSIEVKDSVTKVSSNLIDIGYGASQVIPVLRACLSPAMGPLFIEQPEIHLHPRAQGILAELLCETSLDRQVIVETHSVHMINRARILVAEGKLKPEHVIVQFVNRNNRGSYNYTIPILNNGDFGNEWPSEYGFFDDRYDDTMLLLKLKNR